MKDKIETAQKDYMKKINPLLLPDSYIELITAILKQAEKDYRLAIENKNENKIKELKRFYKSEWGQMLTGGNGKIIMERIEREMTK